MLLLLLEDTMKFNLGDETGKAEALNDKSG